MSVEREENLDQYTLDTQTELEFICRLNEVNRCLPVSKCQQKALRLPHSVTAQAIFSHPIVWQLNQFQFERIQMKKKSDNEMFQLNENNHIRASVSFEDAITNLLVWGHLNRVYGKILSESVSSTFHLRVHFDSIGLAFEIENSCASSALHVIKNEMLVVRDFSGRAAAAAGEAQRTNAFHDNIWRNQQSAHSHT